MDSRAPVLFLQKRSHRAGAQTSLARILKSRALSHIRPVALLGSTGWLHDELSRHGIPSLVMPFPSPRAVKSRLLGLTGFGRAAKKGLSEQGITPKVVFANDHQECPLAVSVSRAFGGIPVIGLLRSAGMNERDFRKYDCSGCNALLCVGDALREKVYSWTGLRPGLLEEGFTEEEFHPLRELPQRFPERVLVLGTEDPAKGFSDFIEAVDRVEARHPDFPALTCDFTGQRPEGCPALLAQKRRATLRFLGRIDDFADQVRTYPLAIHPSRAETFGLAPVEALLAGTATLASATGVFASHNNLAPLRFPPRDPAGLADKLVETWKNWPSCFLHLGEIRESLRASFHIDQTAQSIKTALASCGIE